MIELRDITADNWEDVANLKVAGDQQSFVAPNVYSIAESKFYPGVEIKAIHAGETLVGFIMWGPDPVHNPPEMWIWRFMIAAEHQGNGYGRAAMQAALDHLRAQPGVDAVFLSFEPDNTGADRLYTSLGFRRTGRVEYGEIVVKLEF